MRVDVAIFGGGAAGLWLLDELRRRGYSALLLEAAELGQGQTAGSQGIIHGGLKYTLQGMLTPAARRIRDMPAVWRDCLAGSTNRQSAASLAGRSTGLKGNATARQPDLTGTRLRSEFCYLWRTDAVRSRLGMIGARFGLRVAPESLPPERRPAILAACPGGVARLNEQVIVPQSFVAVLAAQHGDVILRVDAINGVEFDLTKPGQVRTIGLTDSSSGYRLELEPTAVALTAGSGNGPLRRCVGLPVDAMQLRPLHMVMLRGRLPWLNGHCVDGATTRVTVTSDIDSAGRTIWQLGGQLAEQGVTRIKEGLLASARSELESALPGIDLDDAEWATYRVNRAEGATPGGKRPETVRILQEGNVITAWPTKLALVPQLAEEVADRIASAAPAHGNILELPADWPRPRVAPPPWEKNAVWMRLDQHGRPTSRAA